MKPKPTIRKQDGQWTVTTPAYGFNQEPYVRTSTTWEGALAKLSTGPCLASGAQALERIAQEDYDYRLGVGLRSKPPGSASA